MNLIKKAFLFIAISLFFYLGAGLMLTFWPEPQKKKVDFYDFSSIKQSSDNTDRERWLLLRDKTKLFYHYFPSEAKCTMIIIHGSGTDSRYLSNIANYVSENRLARVITPDLRGHGRTSKTKGDIEYIGQYEDDLEDLILEIKSSYPDEKIVLTGHSSGGGLVLRYAGNSKMSPVDAYVMFAPYLGHEATTIKPNNSAEWVTVVLKRFIGLSMLNNLGIKIFNNKPVLLFNLPDKMNDSLQTPSYSYRLAMSFQPNNYLEDIPKINRPNLVLIGDKDESFYPEQFPIVFKDSKYTKVKIIPNTKHIDIMNSTNSQNEVSSFLKELSKN